MRSGRRQFSKKGLKKEFDTYFGKTGKQREMQSTIVTDACTLWHFCPSSFLLAWQVALQQYLSPNIPSISPSYMSK